MIKELSIKNYKCFPELNLDGENHRGRGGSKEPCTTSPMVFLHNTSVKS